MQDTVFDVTNVSRRYNAGRPSLFGSREFINAVDGVTLSVKRDEVLGIIGESGSGKSTLGFLMAGIENVSNGEIAFRGKPLAAMNRSERKAFRQKVQVVFQDSGSALNPRRRIINTLRDSLRLRGMPRHSRDASAIKLLEQVGLSSVHAGRYPHELSGGQRQRVGIARALAMEPEVLIADEPVSALDVSLQGQIINLLLELKAQLKLTIVFISHDIAVVNHACDRVAVMYRGRLVEVGATDDIVRNPGDSYTAQLLAAVPRGLAGRNCSLNSDALPTGEGE